MAKIGQLKHVVNITKGFPGTYQWNGGTSYYLIGKSSDGGIHFSVNGNANDEFTSFHVTHELSGTNVGIWFHGSDWDNNNTKNLPEHKEEEWEKWWKDNESKVKEAAAQFWTLVQA
jgi:hypothetical protein